MCKQDHHKLFTDIRQSEMSVSVDVYVKIFETCTPKFTRSHSHFSLDHHGRYVNMP